MTKSLRKSTGSLGVISVLVLAAACGGVSSGAVDDTKRGDGAEPVSESLSQEGADSRSGGVTATGAVSGPASAANAPVDDVPGGVLSGTPLLDLLPASRLAQIRALLPRVNDVPTQAIFDDAATIWYDRSAIVPGYQDSWGDNVEAPIGFRPNTIEPVMINLAVPGGHSLLFVSSGFFQFPFGVTGGADDPANAQVIDFWHVPKDASGAPLPVVYWKREPSQYTHRIVWTFPKGTVFGEVLVLKNASGEAYAYEVRTRTRDVDGWHMNVFRPFPTAADLATGIMAAQARDPRWAASAGAARVLAHAQNASTLVSARLEATHFAGSFSAIDGAKDVLPDFGEPALVGELLRTTRFRSAKGAVWKASGALKAWASSTNESFSIVPKNYHGGFLEVDDATCSRCHQDAGRPFQDSYPQVVAYGELWGEDEIFSWHPFETANFVDTSTGGVKNFNYDNRVMRADFVRAGLVAPYDATKHTVSTYKEIPRPWRNYTY